MTHVAPVRSHRPNAGLPAPYDAPICRNQDLHNRSVERVIRAMTSRLDVPLSNEDLADIACFSPCHFNRMFRRVTGIPPVQFHYALRLEKAKQLLVTTDLGITDICFEVGYSSLGTFVTRFSELVGLSPSAFRRFARRVTASDLAELRPRLSTTLRSISDREQIVGTVEQEAAFDGLVFVGLFRRAIPEGQPVNCALVSKGSSYSLTTPSPGEWYAFAVAVPWTASGIQLFTLDDLARGRSGCIRVEDGRWSGDSTILLRSPRVFDPPILPAIPLLMTRLPAVAGAQAGELLDYPLSA
jgi:AraC family transcriptional regulator